MIKKRPLIIIAILGALGALAWFYFQKPVITNLPTEKGPDKAHKPAPLPSSPVLNGRRVMNLPPGREKEALEAIKINNKVSEHWEEGVEHALKAQGGDAIKDITITKIESLIWTQPGFAINVESVVIGITNLKGERTSFRALVDSENGKIIQTWDQPVIDSINPRENMGIKVDPRYLND